MRRLNLILGLLAVGFMGPAHAEQSGEVRRVVHASHPVSERIESGGSPVVRAIFSEVNCLGYIEGKNLLIARYPGEGCTADDLADEGVACNPDHCPYRKPDPLLSRRQPPQFRFGPRPQRRQWG